MTNDATSAGARIERALCRLESDDLVRRAGEGWRSTPRLEGAIGRAGACLALTDTSARDEASHRARSLALALVALYGPDAPDAMLADMADALRSIPTAITELRAVAGARG